MSHDVDSPFNFSQSRALCLAIFGQMTVKCEADVYPAHFLYVHTYTCITLGQWAIQQDRSTQTQLGLSTILVYVFKKYIKNIFFLCNHPMYPIVLKLRT